MRRFKTFQDMMAEYYPEKAVSKDGKRIFAAKSFTFQVTENCNLACSYCYQTNKSRKVMSFETAQRAIDMLLGISPGLEDYFSCENSPAIVLEFIGGEPFLATELIDKIVDDFRIKAIKMRHPWADKFCISICSNGTLYFNSEVQRFLQKNANHIGFAVTVDGTKSLHDSCRIFPDGRGSYDLAHAAATDWMKRGYYMGSKITIAPENVAFVDEALRQMVEDGYHDINANVVFEDVWEHEHAEILYEQICKFADWFWQEHTMDDYFISLLDDTYGKPMNENDNNNWCGGTGLMLALDTEGRFYPCIRYMESSLGADREPLIIGDVYNGLGKRKAEADIIRSLQCITRRSQSTDECFYCKEASGCSWCSALNYQLTGSANKRLTCICEMHKARVRGLKYFWSKDDNHYH